MSPIEPVESPEATVCQWSDLYNDGTADVIYVSSDDIWFRIHSVLLRAHSEVLAPEYGSSLQDPVHLPEPAAVLNLLFDFLYPDRPPAVELDLEFDMLLSLSEAAAKYRVFPAMYVCSRQLRNVLPSHAVEVLAHAYKHRFFALANDAAIYAIDGNLIDVLDQLPLEIQRKWLEYHQKWTHVQTKALTDYLPPNNRDLDAATISRLAGHLSSLASLSTTFNTNLGAHSAWKSSIEQEVAAIPKFTELLGWMEEEGIVDVNCVRERRNCPLILIKSSDGTGCSISADILRACTTNMGNLEEETVSIPESSMTIKLLLKFIQPVQPPDLQELPFLTLKDLALAAEKYSIRQAKGFCRLLMKEAAKDYPHDIFHYAAEANYVDILDLAAPLVIGPINSFNEAIKRLPPRLVAAWVLYYQQWQNAVKVLFNEFRNDSEQMVGDDYGIQGVCDCAVSFFNGHLAPILSRLLEEPGEIRNLDTLITGQSLCYQAQQAFDRCKVVATDTINAIPPLSSFLL